jgi:hypothetical protein
MADLKPTFSLTMGALSATSASAAGGPTAFLVQRDMQRAADGLRATLTDRSDVSLGDPVQLSLGHDGTESTVFTGAVQSVRPTVAGCEIWALGGLHELLRMRVGAVFESQTAGATARDLCGRAGLTPGTVDEGPVLPRYIADPRLSAHRHLQALADRLGFELYADVDGKVMFHDPASALFAAGERYVYGQHLLALTGRREPVIWEGVDVGGESPVSGEGDRTIAWLTAEDSSYRGSGGSGDSNVLVLDPAARTKDLADRFAAGWVTVAARTAAELHATVLGRPALDLGGAVSISSPPDALAEGSGYVRAIRHRFGPTIGFVTDVRVAVAS